MNRVLIVFNKWWEFDPGFDCVLSDYARPGDMKKWWPKFNDHPRPRRNPDDVPCAPASAFPPRPAFPRATFTHEWGQVELWCISDLLENFPDKGKWQSSAERKAERLPDVFKGETPRLVIAVGTAAAGDFQTLNGSVVIGTKCYLHNSRPNGMNPDSNWQTGPFDVVLDSSITETEFTTLTSYCDSNQEEVVNRFFPPPVKPACKLSVYAEYTAVALGNINVSDYRDFATTDRETLEAFRRVAPLATLGSLETTHGLIRCIGTSRFLFISGIVDRLLHFDDDVGPKPYAQNTTGAHNAGIVLAWLLSKIKYIL